VVIFGKNGAVAVVNSNRAYAEIDLRALSSNVRALKRMIGDAKFMAVVKADAYGHGAVECARAARDAGADWLGVCFIDEALELRRAGIDGPILAWLLSEDDDFVAAIESDIDLSVTSVAEFKRVEAAFAAVGKPMRVHIELDTGLARAGAAPYEWEELFTLASAVRVVSMWSHMANADTPQSPVYDSQRAEFERALELAASVGMAPDLRHMANSAATLARQEFHYDMVRVGMAMYGVSPMAEADFPFTLSPVMTLRAAVTKVRTVPAGAGVSYGHRYVTDRETQLALLPLGYADGLPRAGTNKAPVQLNGARYTASGTICMDQFLIDVGSANVREGDIATIFGAGGPSAREWGDACGTIGYEMTTRLGSRVVKRFID
jgi:alanine racemase